jgi:hypothetical protein
MSDRELLTLTLVLREPENEWSEPVVDYVCDTDFYSGKLPLGDRFLIAVALRRAVLALSQNMAWGRLYRRDEEAERQTSMARFHD